MRKIKLVAGVMGMVMISSMLIGCGVEDAIEEAFKEEHNVKLYYVNEEYIVTGNEELGRMMEPVEKIIVSDPNEQYEDAIDALELIYDIGYATQIGTSIEVDSVIVKDGIATVNVDSEDVGGGSLAEILVIDQIVLTLIDSFEEIDKVMFAVDNRLVETLMGHMDVSKGFYAEEDAQGILKVVQGN